MIQISKNYFTGGEVLFVGYSGTASKNAAFGRTVYQAFRKNGIKVVPFNSKASSQYDQKVYHQLSDVPAMPKTAYLMINKSNASGMIDQLAEAGVSKILFQSRNNVDSTLLDRCKALGVETVVACPMMIFGTGIHRFHAFLAGVKR